MAENEMVTKLRETRDKMQAIFDDAIDNMNSHIQEAEEGVEVELDVNVSVGMNSTPAMKTGHPGNCFCPLYQSPPFGVNHNENCHVYQWELAHGI